MAAGTSSGKQESTGTTNLWVQGALWRRRESSGEEQAVCGDSFVDMLDNVSELSSGGKI